MPGRKTALLVSAAAFAFVAAMSSARADMLVLESTDPHFQAGQRLPGNKILRKDLQIGAYVKVMFPDTSQVRVFGQVPRDDDKRKRRRKPKR